MKKIKQLSDFLFIVFIIRVATSQGNCRLAKSQGNVREFHIVRVVATLIMFELIQRCH